MAKQTLPVVKFNREDAPLPKKFDNGAIGLRAPMPITIKAKSFAHFDFGITCNHPLLVVGGLIGTDAVIFPANQRVVCALKNNLMEDIVLDVGTTVIHVIPVLAADYTLE